MRELSHRYGLDVDPDALIEDLPVGIQQRVEIVKALVRQANVLILDEPTAVLTPDETEELFRIIRQLRDGGTSIIFISHKLKEVQTIADTITVLRRGQVVGQRQPPATEDDLASLMVGRDVQLRVSKEPAQPGEVVFDVADLTVASEQGLPVNGLSFQVSAGEILGIAGVQGNGQTELCEALMGLRPTAAGSVTLNGRDLTRASPRSRLRAGVAYVPEDRREDGLVGTFSVAENLILDTYDRPPFAAGVNLNLPAIRANATALIEEFDVRTGSPPPGRHALRRQPAEGHPGQGGRARAQGADREPAHPGPRRGVDRVRAPPDRRAARPRRRGDHRLLRARRDLRAGRPDRGHVRGQDHRLPRPGRAHRRARPADGGRGRRRPRARVRPAAGDDRRRGPGRRGTERRDNRRNRDDRDSADDRADRAPPDDANATDSQEES